MAPAVTEIDATITRLLGDALLFSRSRTLRSPTPSPRRARTH